MLKMAVLGSNEFTVGFQLAGIKDTIEIGKNPMENIRDIMNRKDIGIVVIDENILEVMDRHKRLEIEDSVEPVFIPISTKAEQEGLKRLIKRSVGVDLLK